MNNLKKYFQSTLLSVLVILACIALTAGLLLGMPFLFDGGRGGVQVQGAAPQIMDKLDRHMTNWMSDSLGSMLSVQKVYWLSDEDLVAPEPNGTFFGETEDPQRLHTLMEDAAGILEGQSCYFDPDRERMPGSKVKFYLDETIFAVTWKEIHGNSVYTFSEIKIAHPSQFRRFLSGGEYGFGKQFYTTEMSASVNAVVAASGDFYGYRPTGTVVYNGTVHRVDTRELDCCMIDENGDLKFVYARQLQDEAEMRKFVKDNQIRFSLSFGPVLIDDGQLRKPAAYPVGEVYKNFSRAALCQMDQCHYLLCTANYEGPYGETPNLFTFANVIHGTGCVKAYTLDGGQTASLVMDDRLVNQVSYGNQRLISDIIYFATAVPEGG